MNYIKNWFHFYSTTESFETHRKLGMIKPDSICFLGETGQIYTNETFFGICRERFEKLEQLVLRHDAQIKDILGIEGLSVNDGVVNNIADLVNFLDGFTDKDNLKDFLDAMRSALESQINSVNKSLSGRIIALEDLIKNDSESLRNTIDAISSKVDTINIRLDSHDTAISALNTSLTSHIREYNLLKDNYENFKSYTNTKLTAVDSSIFSINTSISALQQEFIELDNKFDNVENEVAGVGALLEDAKGLVQRLEDRFGETLVSFEQFKEEVNDELNHFKTLTGSPYGIAPLDGEAKVPSEYLPSYVDDVLEYATKGAFPVTGESGKIYVALDTNLTYRWSGSTYTEISKSLALGETTSTAYPGSKGKKVTDDLNAHITNYVNPHRVTKEQVGLGDVDNTRDIDKPLSTAMIEALANKVEIEPGKGLISLEDANKVQAFTKRVDEFEDTLNSEIDRATKAENTISSELALHKADNANPHGVTAAQVGLGNVDNTSDKDKPISDAAQNLFDTKVDKVTGKGLSTNDFTDEDKAKLDNSIPNRKLTSEEIKNLTSKNVGDLVYNTTINKYVYWNGTSWEEVGVTDLSDYITKTELETEKDAIDAVIDTKVDKTVGKGLSANDFTDDYKDILDNPWGETIE